MNRNLKTLVALVGQLLLLNSVVACVGGRNQAKQKREQDAVAEAMQHWWDIRQAVIEHGDERAYEELSIHYLHGGIRGEGLYYSMLMAHRHDSVQGYIDVFFTLADDFAPRGEEPSERTADLAITYLLLAAEKGHPQAIEIVSDYEVALVPGTSVEQLRRIESGKPVSRGAAPTMERDSSESDGGT